MCRLDSESEVPDGGDRQSWSSEVKITEEGSCLFKRYQYTEHLIII